MVEGRSSLGPQLKTTLAVQEATGTVEGNCKLCGKEARLLRSHVIPRFAYKWLRQTSATGHLRPLDSPNRRVQDGPKYRWCCRECEDIFQEAEGEFAKNVFFPFANHQTSRVDYGRWMMMFCVSLTWRTALASLQASGLNHCSPALKECAQEAMDHWRRFLLNDAPNPGPFQQHLLQLDAITAPPAGAPPSIHRYLFRAIDLDVLCSAREAIVWVKLPSLLLIGWIRVRKPFQWKGTRLRVRRGQLHPRKTVLPGYVLQQLFDRASRGQKALESISSSQREKIAELALRDPDRTANSDSFYAVEHDVRLFGRDAFVGDDDT